MTNATATDTVTYQIFYPVQTYQIVYVERSADLSKEDLLASVTKDDLANGESNSDGAWDTLKDAWRNDDVNIIRNADTGEELFDDYND